MDGHSNQPCSQRSVNNDYCQRWLLRLMSHRKILITSLSVYCGILLNNRKHSLNMLKGQPHQSLIVSDGLFLFAILPPLIFIKKHVVSWKNNKQCLYWNGCQSDYAIARPMPLCQSDSDFIMHLASSLYFADCSTMKVKVNYTQVNIHSSPLQNSANEK